MRRGFFAIGASVVGTSRETPWIWRVVPWIALNTITLATASAHAQAQPHAQQPELIQYTARAGDTCTTIAERVYGSATRIDVIHIYNRLGAMPHRFRAGQVLTLPRTPPPPRPSADAEVSLVRNDVQSYTPGEHRARVQEPLTRGNRVGTNRESSADVTLANERGVHLEENTLVVVLGRYSFQSQQRETAQDTQLEHGTLRTALAALSGAPPPQPIAVATPAAQVYAAAGETEVTVEPTRATRVAVLSGQAEVSARGQRVVVPAGSGSTTEMGRPPAPPHQLPPRPTWEQAPPRVVMLTGGTSSAVGAYRVASNTASVVQWRVQLARDVRFRQLIIDRRVDPNVNRFEARELPEGHYYLRVRSVDAQHFESVPSEPQHFAVVIPEIVPSVPGRRAAVRVLDGLHCAFDDAQLEVVSAPLEMSPGRAHTLRCADNAEGTETATFAIAAANSGLILARMRPGPVEWDQAGAGSRRVAIRVIDAAGAPLEGLPVAARAENATLDALERAHESGTYFATLRWQGPAPRLPVHVAVAGNDVAHLEVPEATPPPSVPVTAPAPRPVVITVPVVEPERPRRFAAGVGAGAIIGFGPLGIGFATNVNFRYRHLLGAIDLHIGPSVGFERFACAGDSSLASDYCRRAPTSPTDPRITVETASFGLPLGISHRFGTVFRPYITAEPQLLVGRSRITTNAMADGATRVGFGVVGTLGAEFELGMHAPFLEVGYRYAVMPDARLGDLDMGGLALTAGYRAQW